MSGFGVDPTIDGSGNITSGTTSQDIRNINAALYSPGIISGCQVTLSSTDMTYNVAAGVAAIQMATGETVLAPVPATTITASTVSSTGGRTDYIYVQQLTPATDGDSGVVVTYGQSVPQRAQRLDTYVYSAGATNTAAGTRGSSIDYSIPYSGGLGRLYYYQYTLNGNLPTNTSSALQWIGNGTIYLPTDRMTTWRMSAVLSAANATGFDNAHYAEYGFLPTYDTSTWVIWTTGGLHQAWQTYNWQATIQMSAGLHTVKFGMFRESGNTPGVCHYGPDAQGFGRRGMELEIYDAGVVQ